MDEYPWREGAVRQHLARNVLNTAGQVRSLSKAVGMKFFNEGALALDPLAARRVWEGTTHALIS